MTVLVDSVINRINNKVEPLKGQSEYILVLNETDDNVTTCEAVDCSAKATTSIEVDAGNDRTISLSLCDVCVRKFVG